MSASIIDGKATAKEIKQEVAKKAEVYAAEFGRKPGLAVVIVGDDPASRVYVNGKKKACAEVGLLSEEYALPEKTTQEELLSLVDRLNASEHIDGILVQLSAPVALERGRDHCQDRSSQRRGRISSGERWKPRNRKAVPETMYSNWNNRAYP